MVTPSACKNHGYSPTGYSDSGLPSDPICGNAMIKALLHYLGTRLARPFYGGAGCIIALHRVIPEEHRSLLSVNRALEITPEDLDAMIQLLRRQGFDFVPMDAVLDRLRSPRSRRFVAFTLDDGYRDNAEHALPVFERHAVPFTVYATRGFSERTDSLWWLSFEEVLRKSDELTFADAGHEVRHALPDDATRANVFQVLAHRVRECRLEERTTFVNAVCKAAKVDPLRATQELILSPEELQKLARHPLATIGAHTLHHLVGNRLDETSLHDEFAGSKRWLEELCGNPVAHLAYPFGGRNSVGAREFHAAQSSGFATAVTTRFATLFPSHREHAWALPRLEISGNYRAELFTERATSGLLPAIRNRGRRVIVE